MSVTFAERAIFNTSRPFKLKNRGFFNLAAAERPS